MHRPESEGLVSLLKVRDLRVEFTTPDGVVKAVDGVSFDVESGQTLAIVGESGSGKSVSNLAYMGLLPNGKTKITGSVILETDNGPVELIGMAAEEIQKIRGKDIAMIFQDPMSALHPFYSIGDQLIEAHQAHNKVDKKVSRARAIELLTLVGVADPEERIRAYPHQFSGGMRQRVMIAMALMNNPSVLIADEPTTALDVTVQAQILKLISDLQAQFKMAVILITHDLGVVAGAADRVNVMYAGKLVESAEVDELYAKPKMPYTIGLLGSVPRMDRPHEDRLTAIPGQPPSLMNLSAGCSFA
ncbi:MAG: ATP-binding cassette domain-containing protein, partial [Actinobacteria bacterium]|nr:ATP-binding cassette domain-containing protein [Actinomycetota bacterium]